MVKGAGEMSILRLPTCSKDLLAKESDLKGFSTRLHGEKADSRDCYARSPLSAKDGVHFISTPTQP